MKARGAVPIESKTVDTVTDFACAEPMAPKPLRRNITHELAREVCLDVGPHRLEGEPPLRRVSVIRTRRDRAEQSGRAGAHRLVLRVN